MRRYWAVFGLMLACFLGLFVVARAIGIPQLDDPAPWLARGGPAAAAVGVGLLIADVLLPVPSSFVMVAHGAMFGVLLGTALSLVGSVGAAVVAFGIGRRGGSLLLRVVGPGEQAQANRLLERWGTLAIIVSRPLPLIAETVSVMAGASTLGWGRATLAALVGSIPASVLYAITGATAATLDSALLMFALVMVVAGASWVVGKRVGAKPPRESTHPAAIQSCNGDPHPAPVPPERAP